MNGEEGLGGLETAAGFVVQDEVSGQWLAEGCFTDSGPSIGTYATARSARGALQLHRVWHRGEADRTRRTRCCPTCGHTWRVPPLPGTL